MSHFQQLSEQINAAEKIITEEQKKWYQALVQEKYYAFEIDVDKYFTFSQTQQFFSYRNLQKKHGSIMI
ncbi:hypothetical protein GCM10025857_48120 [Alicyclobacillus contaminans]|nr:hypothetical protein GCM10025857_48120 [Alicyclobacillus contaminans]